MTLPASQGDAVARPARGDGLRLELIPDMPSAGLTGRGHLTVKVPELASVPPGVVTEIFPVVAPDGTVAVICV